MKLSTALLFIAGGALAVLYFPEPGITGFLGSVVAVGLLALGCAAFEWEVEQ